MDAHLLLGFSWNVCAVTDTAGIKTRLHDCSGTAGGIKLYMLTQQEMCIRDSRFICRGMRQYKHILFKGLLQRSISSFQKEAVAQCMSALSNDATVIEKNNLEAIFEICTYGTVSYTHLFLQL